LADLVVLGGAETGQDPRNLGRQVAPDRGVGVARQQRVRMMGRGGIGGDGAPYPGIAVLGQVIKDFGRKVGAPGELFALALILARRQGAGGLVAQRSLGGGGHRI
jgi:hypothetical protein